MEFNELEVLQDQLFEISETPPGIDEIQAIFAAVAVGPTYVSKNQWLPFIFGEDEDLLKEARKLTSNLEIFFEYTVQTIHKDAFIPIFRLWESGDAEEEKFDPKPWSEAFNDAMNLHGDDWIKESDEDLIMTLLPVSYFLDPELVTKQLKIENVDDLEHIETDMMDLLGPMVINLLDYFQKMLGDNFQKTPGDHILPFHRDAES